MPNYHAIPKISSLAAHATPTEAIYSRDMLLALLDGHEFLIGRQRIRSASDERTILKQTGWASRPTRLWDER
jgi:hypothetical protein